MLRNTLFALFSAMAITVNGQSTDADALFIKKIYDHTLTKGECHDNLRQLCKQIGPRLSGSDNYDAAALYCQSVLEEYGVDTVIMQPCDVRTWHRGEESLRIVTTDGKSIEASILSLGFSEGTNGKEISGEIIEVKSLDEVKELGKEKIEGKIVFYNRPMDPTQVNTFRAYGGAVDQRVYGATTAAEFGAIASITRSMTVNLDDVPHTGTLYNRDEFAKIPGIAISTMDAEVLSEELKKGSVTGNLTTSSYEGENKQVYSVVGEIKGSERPEEIILVGGHLDSWDVGEGAHDDGTGVVQAMQVLETLKEIDYQPKRTIRCVLFANEESGLSGGRTYAEVSNNNEEYHLAAIESDRGGFIPKGFDFEGHEDTFTELYASVSKWADLFEAYGLLFGNGGSGADIGPLKSQKGLLIGLRPDSQRYFDYHHTHADTFEAVNKRELEMGAAAMTSLVYLIDKYGL